MKKLASCIPTYNRPDIIEEFLDGYMYIYKKLNIDVYIYDSSENDDTKQVVEKYLPLYENLSYERIDPKVHSNMKVYHIYQHYQRERSYEYLWICADALRWTEDVIEEILTQLQKSCYNLLIVNHHDVEKIGTREYTDPNQLFLDAAWFMTLYGATIVRMESLLKDVDWDYMIEKYCIPERINFSHVALYFEQMLKVQNFRAYYYSIPEEKLVTSRLKKFSGWHEETFEVWCNYWSNMINALPDFYTHKKEVIKKNGTNSEILTHDNIVRLRLLKVYNVRVFMRYIGKWHKLVDVNPFRMLCISIMPGEWILEYTSKKAGKKRENETLASIELFCKKYKTIYIYGCGQKADRYAGYLKKLRIRYSGHLVSQKKDHQSEHNHHQVLEFNKEYLNSPDSGILMALNDKNCSEVFLQFPELDGNKQVYCGK